MRKILISIFLALTFSPGAHAAESSDVTLFQTITQTEAQELNISIPDSTPVGYKSLEVQISGMQKVAEYKKILFCKEIDGVIHWNNICPQLEKLNAQTALAAATLRSDLPPYSPLSNPRRTTDTAIIAFAALTLMTGAGAAASRILGNPTLISAQPGYLAQLSRGGVFIASAAIGRGDKAEVWRSPISRQVDGFFVRTGRQVSGISPLATRIFSDGNYLRTFIGPFALAIYPIAGAVGWYATRAFHQQALPPTVFSILLMMLIGVMDALAGLVTSILFIAFVAASGNLNSISSMLTVSGVCLLAFSPALLAGAFRPIRRVVWNFSSLWERASDYLLAGVLTGWVVEQIVLGLPGLSGLQLPLTAHAREIAYWATGLILIRFAAEDIALRLFPRKLTVLEPHYKSRTRIQQLFSTIFKVALFAIIASRYIGISPELLLGSTLFAIPLVMGIFVDRFPKSASLQRWMPTGMIEMLFMTFVGYFLAVLVQDRYPSARTYVLFSFVILSIPGFVLKILALFGSDGAEDWKVTRVGVVAYRILGVMVFVSLIYIIFSGLLISNNV